MGATVCQEEGHEGSKFEQTKFQLYSWNIQYASSYYSVWVLSFLEKLIINYVLNCKKNKMIIWA